MEIRLKPNESYIWKDLEGTKHTISVTRFLEHDHEHLTVYYLDFPLTQKDIEEEKDSLVISVQGFGFSEAYTGSLGANQKWHFNKCPLGELYFERIDEEENIIVHFFPKK